MKLTSKTINYTVETVDELLTLAGEENAVVVVTDENRGGTFVYRSANASENNGGTIFNGWCRQYDGAVNVKWFGASKDNTGEFNNSIFEKVLNSFDSVDISKDSFLVTSIVVTRDNLVVFGGGKIYSLTPESIILKIIGNSVCVKDICIDGMDIAKVGLFIVGEKSLILKCHIHNVFSNLETSIGLRLNCNGFNVSGCTIENTNSTSNGIVGTSLGASRCIYADASNISPTFESKIEGNLFKNSYGDDGDNIHISYTNVSSSDSVDTHLKIYNNTFIGFTRRAIKVYGNNTVIYENTVDTGELASQFYGTSITTFGDNNTIRNNNITIRGGFSGIDARPFNKLAPFIFSITDNTILKINNLASSTVTSISCTKPDSAIGSKGIISGNKIIATRDLSIIQNINVQVPVIISNNELIGGIGRFVKIEVSGEGSIITNNTSSTNCSSNALYEIWSPNTILRGNTAYNSATPVNFSSAYMFLITTTATNCIAIDNTFIGTSRYESNLLLQSPLQFGDNNRNIGPLKTSSGQNQCWFGSSSPLSDKQVGNSGDIVYNSTAEVGQPQGWKCVVSGRPGTWIALPLIV